MKRHARILFATLCATTAATWAWWFLAAAIMPVAIADANLDVWLHHLDDQQRFGVQRVFNLTLNAISIPSLCMNVAWATFVG